MKKRILIIALVLLVIGAFAACRNEPLVAPTPAPVEAPVETPLPEPEPDYEPEPTADETEWPNWIDTDEPHWWNKPGWGIATTVDGTMWTMNLYFNAPPELRGLAEEMAITLYLNFVLPDLGFYHHTFPLISAAAEGDLAVRSRIVEALASRIIAMRDVSPELYYMYIAHFSDRGLVYDEVTRDIFLELQEMLTGVLPVREPHASPELSVSDMLDIFAARALEEPREDEMLPTLIPVEDMQLFLGNPAAFLEVIHSAGAPFYGWGQYGSESEAPIGTWELDRFAWYIVTLRFADPVLYGVYHDFLASVAELELSEPAQQSFDFLLGQIEEIYTQQREWRDA